MGMTSPNNRAEVSPQTSCSFAVSSSGQAACLPQPRIVSEMEIAKTIRGVKITTPLVRFDVELLLSPCWVWGNIGSTDATKTCHTLNTYIFETNNRKVLNTASLDSLYSPICKKTSFNPPPLNPSIQ
jgi:hypothetical protein